MRRTIHFAAILFFLSLPVLAFCAPLFGTYTVGGSSPNYATFGAAVSDLNNLGVSGPVTFNVRPGIYNESITINTVNGASSANTITFQAENLVASSVTITYQYSTVVLNASHYVTFNDMTIEATVELYQTTKAFVIQGNSTYCSITNCILNCPIAPWTDYTFVIYTSSGTNDNILVSGCQINGAGFGYESEGGGTNYGPCLVNNIWSNQTYMAIDLTGTNQTLIQGNTITSNCVTTPQYSGPVTGSRFGIILWNGCKNVQVLENKIYDNIEEGMYIPSIGGGPVLIANNFIQAQQGINGAYSNYYTIVNNSFYTTEYGIYFWYICYHNILENNIFYCANGSPAFNLDSTGDFDICDYNAYYYTGATFTDIDYTPTYATFTDWQTATGFDTHSQVVLPPYVSDSDLHLTDYASMRFGTPLASVPIDIDYTQRGPNPTVGADDTGSVVSIPNLSSCCGCVQPAFTADPTSICQGSQVQFTDQSGSNATAWSWTFNGGIPHQSTSQNPLVTYDTTGTYSVSLITTISGQSYTIIKNAYIMVNSSPATGVVTASPDSVCPGGATQLMVTGGTGTIQWQSSTDSILFSNLPSATTSSYTTQGLTQNTYYRVEATAQCGTDSSAATVVYVLALPAAGSVITIPDSVCAGNSARVSTTGNAGIIQWQTADGDGNYSNIDIDSIAFNTPALSQPVSYRVLVNNGICTDTSVAATIGIYPPTPMPMLNVQDSLICSSDSARISASGTYPSYNWNNGDTLSYTWVNTAGNYWVSVTDSNECTTVSGHQLISVYQVPSVSIVVQGDTLSSFNSSSYQWFYNGSPIPGDTLPVYVATETGEYAVQIIDTNGCKELSNNTLVTVAGIQYLSEQSISVYPNPSVSGWQLTVDNSLIGSTLELLDEEGRVVFKSEIRNLKSEIPAGSLPVGSYCLYIKTAGGNYTKKMIKD